MALLPPSLDYTDKDFDALRARLQSLISSVFPDWTDFNVANFGNVLLEMYAFIGDVLTFYQDNQAAEGRITTATQRRSMLALAKLIGYRPSGAHAATVDTTLTLSAPAPAQTTIPAGTPVKSNSVVSPISFQLLEDAVFAPGASQVVVSTEHSQTFTETFASTGLPNQEVPLGEAPYLDGASVVSAGNGSFTQVDNFLDSASGDRHYTVLVDQNDRAILRFGNGVNGALPTGTITVVYKTGGGTVGNVEPGSLKRVEGTFTAEDGTPVAVTANNALKAAGGEDRETVEQIRQLAPASLRSNNRSVTKEDFETHAKEVLGIARALMLTSNEDATIPENSGILYVVPTGGGVPSQALLDEVLAAVTVTNPCTLTFQPSVLAAHYKLVDVQATVWLRPGYTKAQAKTNVLAALGAFFAVNNPDGTPNENVDFGYFYTDENGDPLNALAFSDIYNAVRDALGVRKLGAADPEFLLNGLHADVALEKSEFPVLGTVTLIDGLTGAIL